MTVVIDVPGLFRRFVVRADTVASRLAAYGFAMTVAVRRWPRNDSVRRPQPALRWVSGTDRPRLSGARQWVGPHP